MPRRADIDPGEIPRASARSTCWSKCCRAGASATGWSAPPTQDAHGINATGRYLDEVLPGPEYCAHVLRLYDECVQARRPLYSDSLFIAPQGRVAERHTKVLFLPLAEEGEAVNMVLVVQVFFYIDQGTRHRHFVEGRPYKEIVHAAL